MYGWSNTGVGVGGNLAASKAKDNYASVTQMSGIGAGSGGFNINVGGNTDLKGAVIASSASADKNILDTGSLSFSDIQNHEKSSAESISVGGGVGTGSMSGMSGFSGGIGVPQNSNKSSTTQAGIAQGAVVVRDNPAQDLSGLNRTASLSDANGLTNTFDPNKIAQNQQAGMLAGQVFMTAAGDVEQASGIKNGSAGAIALHTIAGGAAAALGGGNALQGALGAGASEAATPYLQQYGKAGVLAGTTLIGGLAGGGAGASTALAGTEYNYALHPDQKAVLANLEEGRSPEEAKQLEAAACALAHCAAQLVDDGSQDYQGQVDLQAYGNSDATKWARDLLSNQLYQSGAPVFPQYGLTSEGILDYVARRQATLQLNNATVDLDANDPYNNHFVTQSILSNSLEASYENTLTQLATFRFSSLLPGYASVNASGLGDAGSVSVNTANGRVYGGFGGNANPIPSTSLVFGWLYSSGSSTTPDFLNLYNNLGSASNGNIRAQAIDNFMSGASGNLSGCVDWFCIGHTYSYGTGNAFEIGVGLSINIKGANTKYSPSGSVTVSEPIWAIPGSTASKEDKSQ